MARDKTIKRIAHFAMYKIEFVRCSEAWHKSNKPKN